MHGSPAFPSKRVHGRKPPVTHRIVVNMRGTSLSPVSSADWRDMVTVLTHMGKGGRCLATVGYQCDTGKREG